MYSWVRLSHLAKWCHLTSFSSEDLRVTRICTDSRTLKKGDVFLALRGEKFDGNTFLEEAVQKGAIALIAENKPNVAVPVLRVANTTQALVGIGEGLRDAFPG